MTLLEKIKDATDPNKEDAPDLIAGFALLHEAREHIEKLEQALTVQQLGEAVHCALRKYGDSNHATNAWKSIKAMPDREWCEVLETAIYGLKIQNGIEGLAQARIAIDHTKPGSEKSVIQYDMPVTVFNRPNARKTYQVIIVDEATAVAARKLLDAIPRARFTYENCGPFASICFECEVDNGDGPEMADIFILTPHGTPVHQCDWKGLVEACTNSSAVAALLEPEGK